MRGRTSGAPTTVGAVTGSEGIGGPAGPGPTRQTGLTELRPPSGYFDAVGGQPLHPRARQAWLAAIEDGWADPARLHHAGRRAGLLLDAARASIAASLGVHPDEIHLAGSTSALTSAFVDGTLLLRPGAVAASAIETSVVLDAIGRHAAPGSPWQLPVDDLGHVDLAALQRIGDLGLLAVQLANAEVGTLQDLGDVAAACPGAPLLADAGQCIGRITLPAGWTMLTAAARDWAGPAGVAIGIVRRGHHWVKPAGSERGWIGGFPDIPGAVAAATALEQVLPHQASEHARLRAVTARLRDRLGTVPDTELPGDAETRLPHVVSVSALYVDGEALVSELDRRGFAVASGSACVADDERPSHVLAAMGALTGGNIRISLPLGVDETQVDAFAVAYGTVVAELRERYL